MSAGEAAPSSSSWFVDRRRSPAVWTFRLSAARSSARGAGPSFSTIASRTMASRTIASRTIASRTIAWRTSSSSTTERLIERLIVAKCGGGRRTTHLSSCLFLSNRCQYDMTIRQKKKHTNL